LRLLAEYRLTAAEVAGAIAVRTPPGGALGLPEYLIRESLLRPHDPFPDTVICYISAHP